MNIKVYLIGLALAIRVNGDWQYRSRPDLSPPRLNITIPATLDVDDGYIFVAPYRGFIQSEGLDGPEQPGGYIFRNDGDLVWSSIGMLDGWVGNFRVTRWQGQDVLQAFQGTLDSFHGHGFGHPTLLNSHYESVREIRCANHRIVSIHEFRIVNERTALIESYQPTPMDLSPYGGSADQQWIADAIIQEFDIDTEELIFEWHSIDHANPKDSGLSLTSGSAFNGVNASVAWDYFHANSVDKDEDGNYLVSARHMSTIYKINGSSGDIIWQLGGKQSDFTISSELEFAYQHDARFLTPSVKGGNQQVISLFDNAARSNGHRGGGVDQISDHSKAKVVLLDTTGLKSNWSATLQRALPNPEHILATSQGNVQTLPNGNIFVNWGQAGMVTEYRANDSEAIFHAHLDSGAIGTGVQSYRGFRFNWRGFPHEPPAIVALHSKSQSLVSSSTITVYVSWNGDTETASWRFFAVANRDQLFLGEVKRTSFETSFEFTPSQLGLEIGDSLKIFAEALGQNGQVLSRTEKTGWEQDVRGLPKIMESNAVGTQMIMGDL